MIRSHQMAIIVLAVVIFFLFDNLREKRSVSLTEELHIMYFKNPCGTWVENRCSMLWLNAENKTIFSVNTPGIIKQLVTKPFHGGA